MNAVFLKMHVQELSRLASVITVSMNMDSHDVETRRVAIQRVLIEDESEDDDDLRAMVEDHLASMVPVEIVFQKAA